VDIFFSLHFSFISSVTGSPQTTGKTGHTGIAQLNHPFLNRQNQGVQQNGAMPHYGGGAEKCARCSKSVYLAEKKVGAGRVRNLKSHNKSISFCFIILFVVLSFKLL